MVGLISGVRKNSLAADAGIKAGEKLCSVDGVQVKDIIELSFYTSDYEVDLEIEATDGTRRQVHIEKYPDEDLGLEFDSAVFDRVATCYNNCVFCFVDQMIPGMRPGLYVRDDDYRLSFLYGNFITLTNMKDEDFERIIRTHLTPLYVSVHAGALPDDAQPFRRSADGAPAAFVRCGHSGAYADCLLPRL